MDGWLEKFQKRHGFRCFRSHGESGSANVTAVQEVLPKLRAITDKFVLRDTYNMDETGLFYAMAPDKTIAARQMEGLKKYKTHHYFSGLQR